MAGNAGSADRHPHQVRGRTQEAHSRFDGLTMSIHKEINFEDEICEHLASDGWLYEPGDWSHYERKQALFTVDLVGWIKDTQPKAWEVLTKNRGGDAQDAVLARVRQQLDQ